MKVFTLVYNYMCSKQPPSNHVLGLIILFQLAVLSVAMLLHPLLDLRVTLPAGTKHTTEIRVLPAYRCVLASLFYNIHEGDEG